MKKNNRKNEIKINWDKIPFFLNRNPLKFKAEMIFLMEFRNLRPFDFFIINRKYF